MTQRFPHRRSVILATLTTAAIAIAVLAIPSFARQGSGLVRGNKPGEWRHWGADQYATRYSPLDQIDASNFGKLQVAWQWDAAKDGPDEYYRTTPLFANGRIFTVATTHRYAYAIDPLTGNTLWSWNTFNEGIRYKKAPRQFAGRGLAYWTDGNNERVIVTTPGYHMVSLDAKTGKPDARFGKNGIVDLQTGLGYPIVPLAVDDSGDLIISEEAPLRAAKPGEKWDPVKKIGADGQVGIDPKEGQIAVSSPPMIVGNTVIVGNSSMHGYYPLRKHNIPGFVRGFDIRTGKQLWKFNLVPQPGEFGCETWKLGCKIGSSGVGKVDPWAPYSADAELGLVYIPVGMPVADEYGGHRPGDNLFANSIVAIDVKTGQRRWHFQLVHHDIWDYDNSMVPNLLDVTIDGKPRKLVAQTTKDGLFYVLDRVTGEPIWPIVETPVMASEVPGEVAAATQPIPSKPESYSHTGLMESDLIDYTPAIKDSALKLAKLCRMGPYFIPASPSDGKGANGPSQYRCSWYAPGASGGVNIDGGSAVDPETGMMYVGSQMGLSQISVQKDPCSELEYTSPHNSCGAIGALPPPPGYTPPANNPGRGGGFGARNASPSTIDGISILKPKQRGGITAYDMTTGDKKWWQPNGGIYFDVPRPAGSIWAGATIPKRPNNGSQPQLIVTKTLLINGTGRGGGAGGRAGGGGAAGGGGRAGGAAAAPQAPAWVPKLYAFDKATGRLADSVAIPSVTSAVPMTFMHQSKQYIVFATGAGATTKLVALKLP
jgi:quinoprotein glucose dehydrogenase